MYLYVGKGKFIYYAYFYATQTACNSGLLTVNKLSTMNINIHFKNPTGLEQSPPKQTEMGLAIARSKAQGESLMEGWQGILHDPNLEGGGKDVS